MATFKDYLIRLFDVSQAQDDPATEYKPTLTKALAAGFRGIIIRVGFGRVIDFAFRWFWTLAKGMFARKPYWYGDYYSHRGTGTTDEQWGERQADVCWNELKYDRGEMPLAWDAEKSTYGGDLTAAVKPSYNRVLRGFRRRWLFLSGNDIELYTSPSLLWLFEDDMKDMDLYLAWWGNNITLQMIKDLLASVGWRGKVHILQVTSNGDIDNDGLPEGLELGFESSGLDLDVYLPNTEEGYKEYTGGFVPTTGPAPAEPPVITPEPTPLVEAFKAQNICGLPLTTHISASFSALDFGQDVQPLEIVSVYESLNGLWLIDPLVQRWVTASPTYMKKIVEEPPVVEPPVVEPPVEEPPAQTGVIFTEDDKIHLEIVYAWWKSQHNPTQTPE